MRFVCIILGHSQGTWEGERGCSWYGTVANHQVTLGTWEKQGSPTSRDAFFLDGSFLLTGMSFFTYGWSLLLTVHWLGLFYLQLKFGLVFFAYGGNRFGLFYLRFPPGREIRFGLFCLRFPLSGNWVWSFLLRFPHRK